jgi:hypothetical protein
VLAGRMNERRGIISDFHMGLQSVGGLVLRTIIKKYLSRKEENV